MRAQQQLSPSAATTSTVLTLEQGWVFGQDRSLATSRRGGGGGTSYGCRLF